MHEAHKVIRVPAGTSYALRCSCSCGWKGPDRWISDPHIITLLADDEDWHDEKIASGPW